MRNYGHVGKFFFQGAGRVCAMVDDETTIKMADDDNNMEAAIRSVDRILCNLISFDSLEQHIASFEDKVTLEEGELQDILHRSSITRAETFKEEDKIIKEFEEVSRELKKLHEWVSTQDGFLDRVQLVALSVSEEYAEWTQKEALKVKEKLSVQWKQFYDLFKTLLEGTLDVKGKTDVEASLTELRRLGMDYLDARKSLTGGDEMILHESGLLNLIETLIRQNYDAALKTLRKIVWKSDWMKQNADHEHTDTTTSIFGELQETLSKSLILAQLQDLAVNEDRPLIQQVFDTFTSPIRKMFRYYFVKKSPSSSATPSSTTSMPNSHWMFMYALEWFSKEHQSQFILLDLPNLARLSLVNRQFNMTTLYLEAISRLFSDLCQLNLHNKSDWLVADTLMDALKFDFLFNQYYNEKYESPVSGTRTPPVSMPFCGMKVFETLITENPSYVDRWLKVEKYKLLSYVNKEIFSMEPFQCSLQDFNCGTSSNGSSSMKMEQLMIDLLRDIKAPFRCGELFIALLQEYIEDELGFLIVARQDTLFSRLLLDLVLPILNIFVDFLESSIKDQGVPGSKKEYTQSRQFLLGSLVTIQYLLDKNEDVLSRSMTMIEPRLLTLQKYCFDCIAKCYFTQLLPILDAYKMFNFQLPISFKSSSPQQHERPSKPMIQLVHQLYLFKACIVRDLSSSTLVIPTIVSIYMGLLERVLYEEVILGHGYSELGVQLLCQDIAYFFDSLQSLNDETDDADASIIPFCVYEFGVLGEVYRIFKLPQKQELLKMMDDELPFKAIGFLKGSSLQISILGLAQVKTLVMLSMGSNLLF